MTKYFSDELLGFFSRCLGSFEVARGSKEETEQSGGMTSKITQLVKVAWEGLERYNNRYLTLLLNKGRATI